MMGSFNVKINNKEFDLEKAFVLLSEKKSKEAIRFISDTCGIALQDAEIVARHIDDWIKRIDSLDPNVQTDKNYAEKVMELPDIVLVQKNENERDNNSAKNNAVNTATEFKRITGKSKKSTVRSAVVVICLLVIAVIIAFLCIHGVDYKVDGDMDGVNKRSIKEVAKVNNLYYYIPPNWLYYEVGKDGEMYQTTNYDSEIIASIGVCYLGDIKRLEDIETVSEISIIGSGGDINCEPVKLDNFDWAYETTTTGAVKEGIKRIAYTSKKYYVRTGNETYYISCDATKSAFDEEKFDEMVSVMTPAQLIGKGKCIYMDCSKEIVEGTNYCEEHICHKEGCDYQGLYKAKSGNLFCLVHENKCAAKECSNEKEGRSDYCDDHKCCVCNKKALDGKSFCEEHQEEYGTASQEEAPELYPQIWMREKRLNNTALGKPTAVEKSMDFDVMDEGHKYKTYSWGEKDKEGSWIVTVEYERHMSKRFDDVVKYPDYNGYVSEISYYDPEKGNYVYESEYEKHEEGIYQ